MRAVMEALAFVGTLAAAIGLLVRARRWRRPRVWLVPSIEARRAIARMEGRP